MTADEEKTLTLLRDSLGDWCLGDIKKAASAEVELPRLAFVGLAAWIDTVSTLYSDGRGKAKGFEAWKAFIAASGYLPNEMRADREVRRLYDRLRNALLHQYGTREVALTHGPEFRSDHWTLVVGTTIRVLHIESLIEVFEAAFDRFLTDIKNDSGLRARVLPAARGLLAPVSLPRDTSQVPLGVSLLTTSAIAASATGPLNPGRAPSA